MINNPGYGHRRIAIELKVNRKKVLRIMKKYNLKPARKCKAPCKPGDCNKDAHNYPCITSILCPITMNFIWVSDFTFLRFEGRFIFLATVLDLYTKEVLGVSVMTRHSADLTKDALLCALRSAGSAPVWFHSDQGSEYDSFSMLELLERNKINISMSPKKSPWRNGSQESFFGRFKIEFGDPERFQTLPKLIEAIYGYISYYNNHRIHSKIRMAPVKFKQFLLSTNINNFFTGFQSPPLEPPSPLCNSQGLSYTDY